MKIISSFYISNAKTKLANQLRSVLLIRETRNAHKILVEISEGRSRCRCENNINPYPANVWNMLSS